MFGLDSYEQSNLSGSIEKWGFSAGQVTVFHGVSNYNWNLTCTV